MEKFILHYFVLLFLSTVMGRFYFSYRKALKKGNMLLSKWAMPWSAIDIVLFITMVYIIGNSSINIFDKENRFAVIYAVCMIISMIFNSKLFVLENGIYFMSEFTSWDKVDEVILESDSVVKIERQAFLSSGYKIRNFHYDDKFLSIIEQKCAVRK